ncbi:MAG: ABC transporter ATP-binding protein [Candidatus Bathyarchaeota archaeon]|jgi:molybdopterin-binding protein
MPILLEVQDISKNFGPINALHDTALKLVRGKITALLGPSGSGKTTLLRILAGLETPTKGTILYEDNLVTDSNRYLLRQKATMVFQKSLFFNTNVFKNISYGLKLEGYSKKEIEDKVGEVLKLVKLEEYENRRANKLSGGEQQRVSLARALILNRKLLLLDEPTVNIDPKNASIIEETISRINREYKTTIVLATHNMFQAEAMSERVALLLEGTIKQVGTKQEIFAQEKEDSNRYLESFTRLENVFSGISKINEADTSIVDVGQNLQIEASFSRSGETTIYVRPEDIIVSVNPLISSARNVFKGRIVNASDFGSIVKLRVNARKEFIVQITKRSFLEMKLNVGSTVFLTFKASSVHLV